MESTIKEIGDVAVESGPVVRARGQDGAIRHAVERIRALTEDSNQYHWHWQAVSREVVALRAELDLVKGESEAVKGELAAIRGSRGFRLLQRLLRIRLFLMPYGSRAEGLDAVAFGMAGGMVRGPAKGSMPVSAAVPLPPVAAPSAAEAPASGDSQEMDLQQRERTDIDDGTYEPRRWRLRKESPPADTALNLIILSANHRTGSTLLQRICNARKGTLIWGEHGGALKYFSEIYASVGYFAVAGAQERDDYFRREEDPNLWIASMCPDLEYVQQAVVSSAREFLATLYEQHREGHDILGFKEVQYAGGVLQLLRRCYPEAHILLLVRNPLNAWKSTPRDWYYVSLEEWTKKWNHSTRCFRDAAETDARCHLIRYEDLIRQEEKTMALLAEAAKVSREQVSAVLGHKIGSINAGLSESEQNTILERCREPMEAFGYL